MAAEKHKAPASPGWGRGLRDEIFNTERAASRAEEKIALRLRWERHPRSGLQFFSCSNLVMRVKQEASRVTSHMKAIDAVLHCG